MVNHACPRIVLPKVPIALRDARPAAATVER